MTNTKQPEALEIAAWLSKWFGPDTERASLILEIQHAKILEIEDLRTQELRAYELTVSNLRAKTEDLEAKLAEEAACTAEEKLRADQMSQQHSTQAALNSEARKELAEMKAPQAVQPAVPEHGEVLVTVSGFTGSGKSAIAGEIEIMCRALGLQVEWPDGVAEKNMTHADWTTALEMYNPRVRIVERNVSHNTTSGADQ